MAMRTYYEKMHDGLPVVVAYTEKTGASCNTILPCYAKLDNSQISGICISWTNNRISVRSTGLIKYVT